MKDNLYRSSMILFYALSSELVLNYNSAHHQCSKASLWLQIILWELLFENIFLVHISHAYYHICFPLKITYCPYLPLQGKKEEVPALTITATGKKLYAVDFHAQLSALQAFSICIAILHSSEASSAIGKDGNKYKLYSNSLKLIVEEEMRHVFEAVAEEPRRKEKRKVEQTPPSFFLDPPFSPMARV